ncbi:MAG: hypothetical protein IPK74_00100 [Deltaproteobacteria bacterium]|nr:hypothetical protein [Deltaproteobacteria bacterium]
MTPTQPPGCVRVAARFKAYNRDVKDVWAAYLCIDDSMTSLRLQIKSGSLSPFSLESLSGVGSQIHEKNPDNTYGILSHVASVVNPQRALLASVALTEDFLKDLAIAVYSAYPQRLTTSDDSGATAERERKLLNILLNSATREEAIEQVIEERVRSLFYGNPIDFFQKDKKVRLDFGSYFAERHARNLEYLAEILARRNIYAHNQGRVDRKYLREVSATKLTVGTRPVIDKLYMRHSLIVMRGLAAVAAVLVNRNVFKCSDVRGTLKRVFSPFESNYTDKARAEDCTAIGLQLP